MTYRTNRRILNKLDALLALNLVLIALVLICVICLVAWELRLREMRQLLDEAFTSTR